MRTYLISVESEMMMNSSRLTRLAVSFLLLNLTIGANVANGANFYFLRESTVATVSSPNVIFQKGNTANETIYANSTSAIVTTLAQPTTFYPISYNVVTGTYLSGTVPGSVNATDSNYFIVTSAGVNPKVAETEFIFAVASSLPSQLNFTIIESYTTTGVGVTIQVFNYTGNAYPTSGQGYFTYTSSSTAGTDETQSLTITTNPQFYVSGSHQVKVKIMGSKNGNWNQQVNLLRQFYYQSTYDYVLKIVNQQATSYNIKLDASPFTPSGISRITNFTAWVYTPTSVQLQVISGAMTIQTGPTYVLGSSATSFLAIKLTTSGSGLSTIDCYLRIYPSGSTTTHTDYRLTFKMN
jgi:hypothetical protein